MQTKILTDLDMLSLIFLPLMQWDDKKMRRKDLALKTIEMAQKIPDVEKRKICLASAVGLARKYLDENELNELLEVFEMFAEIADMIVEKMEKKVEKEAEERGEKNAMFTIAKNLIRRNRPIDEIMEDTNLSREEIENIIEEHKIIFE